MSGGLNYENWEKYLPEDDHQRDFILEGVKRGFKLSELDVPDPNRKVLMKNYFSVFRYRHAVEQQILEELENGRYEWVNEAPDIVSAMGAIPKKNGNVRLIHDCSRPTGFAVNDCAIKTKFQYQTLQDAVEMVNPGDFMSKVDLKNAYRSVKVSLSERTRLGLTWTFEGAVHPVYLVDTCLPFGHSRSPYVFHELSQAVCRIMAKWGYENIVAYLDDFLIICSSWGECKQALDLLIFLLRRLGFAIAYSKVEGPYQRIIFLGFLIDSLEMSVKLTIERVKELNELLKETLLHSKITKRKLQSIIGKLSYCCQVVYGGRYFLRRLISIAAALSLPWHRTRITKMIRADVEWWLSFGLIFCSKAMPMVRERSGGVSISIDACGRAAGAFFMADHRYTEFKDIPGASDLCINWKETLALLPAVEKWAPYFANKTVHVYSDNLCAVRTINKGSCKNPVVMESLRSVFWYSVRYNFRIVCHWYPGIRNVLADRVSRLHEAYGILKYQEELQKWYATNAYNMYYCGNECVCQYY